MRGAGVERGGGGGSGVKLVRLHQGSESTFRFAMRRRRRSFLFIMITTGPTGPASCTHIKPILHMIKKVANKRPNFVFFISKAHKYISFFKFSLKSFKQNWCSVKIY